MSGESIVGVVLRHLNSEYDGKRMKCKKTAEAIFKDIYEKVGAE